MPSLGGRAGLPIGEGWGNLAGDVMKKRAIRRPLHLGRSRFGQGNRALALPFGVSGDRAVPEHGNAIDAERGRQIDLSRSLVHQREIQMRVRLGLDCWPAHQRGRREALHLLEPPLDDVVGEILRREGECRMPGLRRHPFQFLRQDRHGTSQAHHRQSERWKHSVFHGQPPPVYLTLTSSLFTLKPRYSNCSGWPGGISKISVKRRALPAGTTSPVRRHGTCALSDEGSYRVPSGPTRRNCCWGCSSIPAPERRFSTTRSSATRSLPEGAAGTPGGTAVPGGFSTRSTSPSFTV